MTKSQFVLDKIQSHITNEVEIDNLAVVKEYEDQEANQSSIAIKILSIIGGVMGILVFVGLFAMIDLFDSIPAMFITGLLLIVGAIYLNRKSDKLIMDTFSISTFLVGVNMFEAALFRIIDNNADIDESLITIVVMLIAGISLVFIKNYMLSLLSILMITGSLLVLLVFQNETYSLIHLYNTILIVLLTYVFLFEAKIICFNKKLNKLYNPLRIALIISFLFGLGVLRNRHLMDLKIEYIWQYSLVLFGVLILVISRITDVLQMGQKERIPVYILSIVILGVTIFSPSILGAMLLILLSFYTNYKTGLVLGVVALVYFVAQYYYDLNLTLLTKSILLMSSGIVFIILYAFTTKAIKNEKI